MPYFCNYDRSFHEGLNNEDAAADKEGSRKGFEYWLDEEGLFNLDEEGRAERQLCAVAASNVLRNFSFMPENDILMARNSHCLETLIQCIEDHLRGRMHFLEDIRVSYY